MELNEMEDVVELMRRFEWKKDFFIDWRPWVITIINRKLKDDCDGAAVLGRWALKKIGFEADIFELWDRDAKIGHAVCITKNKGIMISNESVVLMNSDDWRGDVLRYHDGMFNIIEQG
jgi:hypothetical protein